MKSRIKVALKQLGLVLSLAVGLMGSSLKAGAQEEIAFATNWKAQGGHAGFYQALADGTYKQYGLDVRIVQGGPQINTRSLLSAGKVDFLLSVPQLALANSRQKIPTAMVAAFFQRDPTTLMAHPGKYKDLADMRRARTIYVARAAQFTYWPWVKHKFGLSDDQVKAYSFTLAPFLADPEAVQQAYATAEPLYIDTFKPDVFLLADYGWSGYSNIIETRREIIEKNPDLVQRFIDASIIGWNNYLYGDRKQANALIKKDNPEMTDAKLDAEIAEIQRLGLVDGGDTLKVGLGAIDLKRFASWFDDLMEVGLYKPGEVDLETVVTDQFVNKGVGLDVRKRLESQ
ncbi:ABC transporter substrate-binding protein [Aminobacter niigataensis]|uniref:ABC transporter substrate-binding protein n=1 Tax=Aminobacter niigataensis TaxID=83265 RepID=UPI0024C7BCB1|nr:ABC transporter substrate-binding protein [Aminobacter niigataensis]CAI2933105.1 Hydroxymethylpyrimidine ABC transporter, substrate-binding component [Aminobacter niigataensis]